MKYGYGRIENLVGNEEYDVIIEAIFGIGLSRNIEGTYQQILNTLNKCKGRKVAVDMPAGISTDSGGTGQGHIPGPGLPGRKSDTGYDPGIQT